MTRMTEFQSLLQENPALRVRRLGALTGLSGGGEQALGRALQERVRRLGPREDLLCEGDEPEAVWMILSGWACRYKTLEDGRRQIINFVLPGDTCEFNSFLLPTMDHSVGALTVLSYAEISRETLAELTASHPSIAQALMRATLVNAAIEREWVVNLGQRVAFERMAHLLCEIFVRLEAVGLTQGDACDFPLTQTDLADATGLSVVHVNRTLQELRGAGLIVLRAKSLTIPDLQALQRAALFNLNYLHLG
jgi:CRP-like cAMP-binding protein